MAQQAQKSRKHVNENPKMRVLFKHVLRYIVIVAVFVFRPDEGKISLRAIVLTLQMEFESHEVSMASGQITPPYDLVNPWGGKQKKSVNNVNLKQLEYNLL